MGSNSHLMQADETGIFPDTRLYGNKSPRARGKHRRKAGGRTAHPLRAEPEAARRGCRAGRGSAGGDQPGRDKGALPPPADRTRGRPGPAAPTAPAPAHRAGWAAPPRTCGSVSARLRLNRAAPRLSTRSPVRGVHLSAPPRARPLVRRAPGRRAGAEAQVELRPTASGTHLLGGTGGGTGQALPGDRPGAAAAAPLNACGDVTQPRAPPGAQQESRSRPPGRGAGSGGSSQSAAAPRGGSAPAASRGPARPVPARAARRGPRMREAPALPRGPAAPASGPVPVPGFLAKLWALLEDPDSDDVICWSRVRWPLGPGLGRPARRTRG